jgi:hypothetical protein
VGWRVKPGTICSARSALSLPFSAKAHFGIRV